MAPHSSTLAWRIPWTEEPGGLQSMGWLKSQTRLSDFTFTFHFHALEKEMATHSSVLAWGIPGTGEPGGLPSMGLHRVGHDWSDLAAAAAVLYTPSIISFLSPLFGVNANLHSLVYFSIYHYLYITVTCMIFPHSFSSALNPTDPAKNTKINAQYYHIPNTIIFLTLGL